MKIKVGAVQAAFSENKQANIDLITKLIRKAAQDGAQVILPPELFENIYFCRTQDESFFATAQPVENHPMIEHFQNLARELKVVLPISFFEKAHHCYYNSLVMIDADGRSLGVYRKSHIPDGPGYQEKFYFKPGDTGFKVFKTQFGTIGIGICWDQWYPETARELMLQGAEILFFPTAIGSEPHDPSLNTKDLWQRAMIGHAVSNVVPVVASNRIGTESGQHFYGHSFIASHRGEIVAEMDENSSGFITAEFDLKIIERNRAAFGFFRDRRSDLYKNI